MTGYRIACLTKNRTNPAYVGAQVGAARLAEGLGCELRGYVPDRPDNVEDQLGNIRDAMAWRPDAMLISPVDATALNDALAGVKDAGVTLVYFVTSTEGLEADAFMTSDNYALAKEIAEYLVRHLGGTGQVAILDGLAQSPTSPPRSKAFRDVVAAHPGLTLAGAQAGDYQFDGGKQAMASLLDEAPALDGVISANDIMALGAMEAMDEAGRSVPIVGMNAMPDAVKAILAGRMLATVSYDALSLVGMAVQAAVRILDGKPVPGVVEMPAEIIDASNCAAWDRPFEQRPLPDWDTVMAALRAAEGPA